MRRPITRALAAVGLLALSSSSMAGWSVALHLATDDHHDHGGTSGLEMALHGHVHDEGTPPHWHPLLPSVAAPIPGKLLLTIGAMVGNTPEVVVTVNSGPRLLPSRGPTHDPPPRYESISVLRI